MTMSSIWKEVSLQAHQKLPRKWRMFSFCPRADSTCPFGHIIPPSLVWCRSLPCSSPSLCHPSPPSWPICLDSLQHFLTQTLPAETNRLRWWILLAQRWRICQCEAFGQGSGCSFASMQDAWMSLLGSSLRAGQGRGPQNTASIPMWLPPLSPCLKPYEPHFLSCDSSSPLCAVRAKPAALCWTGSW